VSYRQVEPVSKQVTIVVGLTVVGFMAFGLALSFYRNVLFDQTLEHLGAKNDNLRLRIEKGHQQLEYYQSAQYKDKYAKEHLSLVNPGEQVLIITEKSDTGRESQTDSRTYQEQQESAYLELLRQMPPTEHWQLYLFHREEMEELKRSFLQ